MKVSVTQKHPYHTKTVAESLILRAEATSKIQYARKKQIAFITSSAA
jgi:hypothetical protein